MTILVLGGTGNIGPHVVRALIDDGAPVRILTRNADRAREVLPTGVELIEGDPRDDRELLAAADGATSVFLLSRHGREMVDTQLGVLRALRRTGVRLVKLSATDSAVTPDGPLVGRLHWEIEQVLKGSETPYTIVRPNAFMQVVVGQLLLPMLDATGRIMNPIADSGVSLVDVRDVGEVAARALQSDAWDGQTLVLTGPRALGYHGLARLIGSARSVDVPVVEITPSAVRTSLIARGMDEWEAEHFKEMYELSRAGESEFVTATVERVLGRAPRTIEAYVDETNSPVKADPTGAIRP